MSKYLIKKIFTLGILLFLVSWIVFAVLFVLPGDPAQIILGINATPETLANLRTELGLDQPFWAQYARLDRSHLSGTGSRSIHYDVPVFDLIVSRLAVTGPLACHGHDDRRWPFPCPWEYLLRVTRIGPAISR